jgi:phosphoenolpyruvate carboxylase
MILAKCDDRIAALYDEVLVTDEKEKELGAELRSKLGATIRVSS